MPPSRYAVCSGRVVDVLAQGHIDVDVDIGLQVGGRSQQFSRWGVSAVCTIRRERAKTENKERKFGKLRLVLEERLGHGETRNRYRTGALRRHEGTPLLVGL